MQRSKTAGRLTCGSTASASVNPMNRVSTSSLIAPSCRSSAKVCAAFTSRAFSTSVPTIILYVLGIQSHNFLKICNIASAAHLPHAGDSWFSGHTASVVKFVLFPFVYCRRAGSYEAHIAS